MRNASSLSYKNTGVSSCTTAVQAVAPPTRNKVAERNGVSPNAYGRPTLAITTDPLLTDKAYRIFGLIGALSWRGIAIPLSFEEIAQSIPRCSLRCAKLHIATLESRGMIRVLRRPGYLNEYVVPREKRASSAKSASCSRCKVDRSTDQSGVCIICRKSERAEREVAEQLAAGFKDQTVIWANLKAHGSKSGSKEIGQAFRKLTVPSGRDAFVATEDVA